MPISELDRRHMQTALDLAIRGQGFVEPNPMVGCVIAIGDQIIAEGWHQRFGDHHAEVNALNAAQGTDLSKATMYVTLEPCSHRGKTPPCADAVIDCGIRRVVVAQNDPFPAVSGKGIQKLVDAGIEVDVGVLESKAAAIAAPYLKRVNTGRPWVLAKWAMTLDGKIATRTGDSKWITNSESRERAHQIRGRMDAIIVGRQTVVADDPMLTARPAGPRVATRVVVDSKAQTLITAQLVQTAKETPTIFAVGPNANAASCQALEQAGCQVVASSSKDPNTRLAELLDALGQREMTNVLVEGGGQLIGSFLDEKLVDEAHVFIAPKVAGGQAAVAAVGGQGVALIKEAWHLDSPVVENLSDNIYISGRISRT